MKLLKLTLTNFKGVRSLTLEPNGKDASIYGTNASGKTTVFDAITWLLFNKGSTWNPNFSPKTLDDNGEEIHNINNRVDATFQLDNGINITFSKELSEKWGTKRGGTEESNSGNRTDYYIDGVPVKKSEYESRISEICPKDKVQVLIYPLYFSEILEWKKRREILLTVCGDVTESDVINGNDDLHDLNRFLLKPGSTGQFYTVDECKKIAEARAKDIRKKLEEIPARIDEATKALVDTDGIDEYSVNASIIGLQSLLDSAITEKATVSENTAKSVLRQQLADLNLQMTEARSAFQSNKNTQLADERKKIFELQTELNAAVHAQGIQGEADRLPFQLKAMTEKREQLVSEYKNISESAWTGDSVCATCEQPLPPEKIEAAKEKFNLTKSDSLERIRKRLENECSKSMIADLQKQIEVHKAQIVAESARIEELRTLLETARQKIAPFENSVFENTEEYTSITAQIAEIQAKLNESDKSTEAIKNAIQGKIDSIRADIENEQKKLLSLRSNEQQQKRINELEKEERDLQTAAEETEYCIHLCELFIKTKVSMLDEKINAKFPNVRFQLFKTYINGGVEEICDVMVPCEDGLIPYSKANNAAKVNAGLEIIDTLAQFWDISMPVFVDNAESVVKLTPIGPQMIRLVVSEFDKQMRMEVDA